MKRRVGASILALTLAVALFGCAKKPDVQPVIAPEDSARPAESTKPENTPEEVWDFAVTTETATQEYKADDGTVLATWSFEQPILRLKNTAGETYSGEQPGRGATAEQLAACKAFNDYFGSCAAQSKAGMTDMQTTAQEQYDEMDEAYRENFMSYASQTDVAAVYRHGDLLSVEQMYYGYWGGVHGTENYANAHFDLKTGEFITLRELSDDPDAMLQALRYSLLDKIGESDEAEYYFDDWSDTVLAKDDFNAAFGEKGMTVCFDEYEIAPYVMGLLEFTIPYAELSRFLNERGDRLLDLPLADKCLGDYYEAEEMWGWFDGTIPQDDADYREIPAPDGDYSLAYYRVRLPGVTTLADLREKLLERFSADVADERLAAATDAEVPLLREFDGVLYVLPAGRGDDMYIDSVDYRVDLNGDETGGRVIAAIQWRDYDDAKEEWVLTGTSDVEFPFELTEAGARFTAFQAIW